MSNSRLTVILSKAAFITGRGSDSAWRSPSWCFKYAFVSKDQFYWIVVWWIWRQEDYNNPSFLQQVHDQFCVMYGAVVHNGNRCRGFPIERPHLGNETTSNEVCKHLCVHRPLVWLHPQTWLLWRICAHRGAGRNGKLVPHPEICIHTSEYETACRNLFRRPTPTYFGGNNAWSQLQMLLGGRHFAAWQLAGFFSLYIHDEPSMRQIVSLRLVFPTRQLHLGIFPANTGLDFLKPTP